MLDIWEAFIPFAWMVRVVLASNVYDNLVDDLYLAINLGVETCGLSELGVQHRLET